MVRKQELGLSQGPVGDKKQQMNKQIKARKQVEHQLKQQQQPSKEWRLTLSLISSIRERLKPEFLFSDLMALMAPDLMSIFACSVAVAVSTTGWSDKAVVKEINSKSK